MQSSALAYRALSSEIKKEWKSRERERKKKNLFNAYTRSSLPMKEHIRWRNGRSRLWTSTRLANKAGECYTYRFGCKTEKRRNKLRVRFFFSTTSKLLLESLCASGELNQWEAFNNSQKKTFFVYSVVLSTHNANLAKGKKKL